MADPRLDALLAAARQQLVLLADARTRPEANLAVVERNALHFLLTALRTAGDAELTAQIDAYLTESAQAGTHLLELAEGWRCTACQQRVPAGAAVSAVKSGRPKLAITCKACGATSPAASSTALLKLFPISSSWDPRSNGFGWDGT